MNNLLSKISFYFLFLPIIIFGIFSIANGQFNSPYQTASSEQVDFFISWSTDAYIPPEYEGRSLPSHGSQITLSAMPLSLINDNDFTYNWLIDLAIVPDGNGSPTVKFEAEKMFSGEYSVYLTVIHNKSGETIKETSFQIPVVDTQSIIYREVDSGELLPLDMENGIDQGDVLNLVAKLFFFNQAKSSKEFNYTWSIDNSNVDGEVSDPDKLSIEFPKDIPVDASYNLNLSIENPFNPFQSTKKSHKIIIQ